MRIVTLVFLCAALLVPPGFGWQDDVEINLRNPYGQFSGERGIGFFRGATSEVRLGRYLVGSDYQRWQGGVEGDVSLVNYGDLWLWHMGLNMETLADDNNEINFRLVQVYYQALTGVRAPLGPGVLHVGYRHRCSHGTDRATNSRITIRSGLTASYHWLLRFRSLQFDIKPGANVYLLGQNSDIDSQPRAAAFLSTNMVVPISAPFALVIGAGIDWELVTVSNKFLYLIGDRFSHWHLEPLLAARLASRVEQDVVKADFGLQFSQNLDLSIGEKAHKVSALSLAVDFSW